MDGPMGEYLHAEWYYIIWNSCNHKVQNHMGKSQYKVYCKILQNLAIMNYPRMQTLKNILRTNESFEENSQTRLNMLFSLKTTSKTDNPDKEWWLSWKKLKTIAQ